MASVFVAFRSLLAEDFSLFLRLALCTLQMVNLLAGFLLLDASAGDGLVASSSFFD